LKFCKSFRTSFHDFGFRLEDLASTHLSEDSHQFTHAPARSADHGEAVGSGLQQRGAIPFYDDNGIRKPLTSFNLEAGKVDLLKLKGRIHGFL
jgi:hypothetical protein